MVFSTLSDIRQFGVTAILGIVCCYVAALIIIPFVAVLINYTPKPHKILPCGEEKQPFSHIYNELLRKLAVKVTKFAIPIVLILCIIGFTGLYLDEEMPVSTDMKSNVPVDMPAIVNINTVTRAMGDTGGFSPSMFRWGGRTHQSGRDRMDVYMGTA